MQGYNQTIPRLGAMAIGAVAIVGIVLMWGITVRSVAYCAFICILLGSALVDLHTFTIPNKFILMGIVIWLTAAATSLITSLVAGTFEVSTLLSTLADSALGAFGISLFLLVFSAIFDRLTGTRSLGGGDIKLFFVTGLFLGLAGNVVNVALSCLLGAAFGSLFSAQRKTGKAFPFGPAIALSTWICLMITPVLTLF